MEPLVWTLKELFPTHGDLLTTLDLWFDGQGRERLAARYSVGHRFHKKQIVRWQQRAQRGTAGRWEYHTIRRLFAIRRAVAETAQLLHGKMELDTWKLLNCQPSGGRWVSTIQKGPTGKRCRSWLCPWCYLRRMHQLSAVLLQPTDALVEVQASQFTEGLGFTEPLNVLTVTLQSTDLFTDRALFQMFRLRAEEISKAGYQTVDGAFSKTGKPEYKVALRTLAPHLMDGQPAGMRIGFIYPDTPPAGDEFLTGLGKKAGEAGRGYNITVKRHRRLSTWDALRIAQPYPVHALTLPNANASCELAAVVLKGMLGLTSYGTVRVRRPSAAPPSRNDRPLQLSTSVHAPAQAEPSGIR